MVKIVHPVSFYRIVITGIFILVICSGSVIAQEYVQVEVDEGTIYTDAEVNDTDHIITQRGDIFKVEDTYNGWIGIYMFSREVRYVKKSDVELTDESEFQLTDVDLCNEIQKIMTQASNEAIEEYGNDVNRKTVFEDYLFDKYMLTTFRNLGVSTTYDTFYVDCINDSIIVPLEL